MDRRRYHAAIDGVTSNVNQSMLTSISTVQSDCRRFQPRWSASTGRRHRRRRCDEILIVGTSSISTTAAASQDGGVNVTCSPNDSGDDGCRCTNCLVVVNKPHTTVIGDALLAAHARRRSHRVGLGMGIELTPTNSPPSSSSSLLIPSFAGGDQYAAYRGRIPVTAETTTITPCQVRTECRRSITASGTFHMKRSRLRQVVACVRTLRQSVADGKRRVNQLRNCAEMCDVIESKGNRTSVNSQFRYGHHNEACVCRDDVIDEGDVEIMSHENSISCRMLEFIPVDADDVRLTSGSPKSYPSESDCSSGTSRSLDWLCDDRDNYPEEVDVETATSGYVAQLIERMIGLEEAFQAAMTLGIQAYSRPLSFHLLTPAEHRGLFQNVEKLVTLSEGHVTLLRRFADLAARSVRKVDGNLRRAYDRHADCTQRAYLDYCNGLLHAVTLYGRLVACKPQFVDYVMTCHKLHSSPSLIDFIQLPIHYQCHVISWCRGLQAPMTPHAIVKLLQTRYEAIRNTCSVVLRTLDDNR